MLSAIRANKAKKTAPYFAAKFNKFNNNNDMETIYKHREAKVKGSDTVHRVTGYSQHCDNEQLSVAALDINGIREEFRVSELTEVRWVEDYPATTDAPMTAKQVQKALKTNNVIFYNTGMLNEFEQPFNYKKDGEWVYEMPTMGALQHSTYHRISGFDGGYMYSTVRFVKGGTAYKEYSDPTPIYSSRMGNSHIGWEPTKASQCLADKGDAWYSTTNDTTLDSEAKTAILVYKYGLAGGFYMADENGYMRLVDVKYPKYER